VTFTEAVAVLRPLQRPHATLYGERIGFFMADATDALGGLSPASNMLMVMLAEGLVEGQLVILQEGEDAHTLYRVANAIPPTVH